MFIELRGVEFVNKGAELMLRSIIDVISKEIAGVKFVMEKSPRAPIHKQRQLGIYTKFNFGRFKVSVKPLGFVIPSFVLNKFGFVKDSQVQVVLDASGFAFGDVWGAKKAGYRLANHIKKWKLDRKKVILLPQAFGPFSSPELRGKMKLILDNADLVFARDRVSYDYLLELVGKESKILLRPDFTNLVGGTLPNSFNGREHQVAIIPNSKMLDVTSEIDRDAYPVFLVACIKQIIEWGCRPFFLIHEGRKDLQIAISINNRLGLEIPIIVEEDPLKVKGILGASMAVVTSRFHGLVSALAQNIPCLAAGWSHKYEMLMEDYDYQAGLCDVKMSENEVKSKIEMILDHSSRDRIIQNLRFKSLKQKEASREMWCTVFDYIGINQEK